jgi:hypothetical protein
MRIHISLGELDRAIFHGVLVIYNVDGKLFSLIFLTSSPKDMWILIWQKQAYKDWGKSRFRWRTSWISIALWNIWCQKGQYIFMLSPLRHSKNTVIFVQHETIFPYIVYNWQYNVNWTINQLCSWLTARAV